MGLGISKLPAEPIRDRSDRDLHPALWAFILFMAFMAAITFDRVVNGQQIEDPKITLGRHLFHDKQVSSDATTACSTCHSADHFGSDGRKRAVGRIGSVQSPSGIVGPRRTPTIVNAAIVEMLERPEQFLDHRAKDPFDQAIQPMSNPDEMGNQSATDVANRLGSIRGYQRLTQQAFGDPQLTPRRMRLAIVSYERTLKAIDTPLARYLGSEKVVADKTALSESEARGAELIKQARCLECHKPPLFTTGRCANNGFSFLSDQDVGLQKTTGNPGHLRAIKIPGWVGAGLRPPYMHNGEFANLTMVVRHYRAGANYGGRGRDPLCDARIRPQKWTDSDVSDIVNCLKYATIPYDIPNLNPPKEPLR